MNNPITPAKAPQGKVVFWVLAGFLAGAVVGSHFGGGLFTPDGDAAAPDSTPESAVTLVGGAYPSNDPSSDALSRLLDSGGVVGLDRTREVLALVDGLNPAEIENQINEVISQRRADQGHDLIRSLYQKWVESDPAEALRHAQDLEGRIRSHALAVVLFAWAAKKPYEVLAWADEHANPQDTQNALNAAIQVIARTDPEGALALAEKYEGGSKVDTSSIFSLWAEKDPHAAAKRALSTLTSLEGGVALRSVAAQWARSDPKAAWGWANGLDRARDRETVRDMIFSQVVADGEVSHAIAFLETMPIGQGRYEALEKIATSLAFQDPEKAYEFVKSHSRASGDEDVYADVFFHWAERDPYRAFDVACEEIEQNDVRHRAIQSALNQIANLDPAEAVKRFGQLDEEARDKIASSVARALAVSNLDIAVAWAEGLPNGETKEEALSIILDDWARVDPLHAVAYGLTIENQSLRRRSLGRALDQWGRDDAVSAMTWAVKNLGAEDQEDLVPRLLGNWVNEDVGEAAEWVADLPDGELRDASVSSLVSSWSSRDLVAAGEWLKQVPKGKGRDSAASNYASQVFDADPEAALVWAESIGDESTRFREVENLARRYLKYEPEKARRWIAGSSLPPEKRDRLLGQTKNQ